MAQQLITLPLNTAPSMSSTNSVKGNPFSWYKELYDQHQEEDMALLDYLELCRDHPAMYASPHERLLQAIGEPVLLNTSDDEQLSRIFSNRMIRTYPSFGEFYGINWLRVLSIALTYYNI